MDVFLVRMNAFFECCGMMMNEEKCIENLCPSIRILDFLVDPVMRHGTKVEAVLSLAWQRFQMRWMERFLDRRGVPIQCRVKPIKL
jgi:hypothetical protein